MASTSTALVLLGLMLAGVLIGALLRRFLPEHHTKDDSKDIMKTAAGMIATLVALVIGLLVSSAKGAYDHATATVTDAGAKAIMLDGVLRRYGPEALPLRLGLRLALEANMKRIWPPAGAPPVNPSALEATGEADLLYDAIRALPAKNDSQQHLKAEAAKLSADVMQARWLAVEHAQTTLPTFFLIMLGFWLTVLFAFFGILSPRNATAYVVLAVSAASMAGAVFLIMELNRPLEGVIKISSAPIEKAIAIIGR